MQEARKYQLQYSLIYSLIVAGKSARFTEKKCSKFISYLQDETECVMPLSAVQQLTKEGLLELLHKAKTGNYTKLYKALKQLSTANIDLEKCKPDELEKIHGIGPKTARFFIMWNRPDERYAALDVHILAWLREQGYNAPKSTPPSGCRYNELEQIFIQEADKRGMTPRELDAEVWKEGANYEE